MRWGLIVALVAGTAPAGAEPLEWSVFFGADKLPKTIALGGASEPEQRPFTGPILGGRIHCLHGNHWAALGFEAEATLTTTWTGYGFDDRRQSYFTPVAGYRVAAMLRLVPDWPVQPHVLGGAGGMSLLGTYSPYVHADTAGVYFWGAGITVPVGRWRVRVDGRELWVPVLGGSREASWEIQIGFGRAIGHTERAIAVPPNPPDDVGPNPDALPPPPPAPTPTPTPEPDHVDIEMPVTAPPPPPAPTPPPPPTPPPAPAVPPAADAAFEAASAVRFDAGKARITVAGKLSLKKLAAVLRDHPDMKVTVTGHDKDAVLAKKRAEAVKWDLVDQGVAADQIDTTAGEPGKTPITVGPR